MQSLVTGSAAVQPPLHSPPVVRRALVRSRWTNPVSFCRDFPRTLSGRLLCFNLVGTYVQFVRQIEQSSTGTIVGKHPGVATNRHCPGPQCGRSIRWNVGTPRGHWLQPCCLIQNQRGRALINSSVCEG